MKHWIFDLDSTLINSFPTYAKTVTEVASHYGVSLSAEDHAHIQHLVLPKFLERVLPTHHLEEAFNKTIQLSMSKQDEIEVYDGIIELLNLLKSKNCTLSVFTARELITARSVLNSTKLDQYFGQLVSRDCVVNTKPHPDGIHKILELSKVSKAEALMVGDHQMDIEAARAAGIKSISVDWNGANSHLSQLSDHHFSNVADFHDWAIKVLSK